jgi:hypothetical protein
MKVSIILGRGYFHNSYIILFVRNTIKEKLKGEALFHQNYVSTVSWLLFFQSKKD